MSMFVLCLSLLNLLNSYIYYIITESICIIVLFQHTSFSISGASTYFFFSVFLNRRFLIFLAGGVMPCGHRNFFSTLKGSFFLFLFGDSSSADGASASSLQIICKTKSSITRAKKNCHSYMYTHFNAPVKHSSTLQPL